MEKCAREILSKAYIDDSLRTCQDMKNNNWRKNRFFAAAQNDREDNQNDKMMSCHPERSEGSGASAQIYCCASVIASKLALLSASEYICRITVYRL